jgi:hypothetical protein
MGVCVILYVFLGLMCFNVSNCLTSPKKWFVRLAPPPPRKQPPCPLSPLLQGVHGAGSDVVRRRLRRVDRREFFPRARGGAQYLHDEVY